MQHFKTGFEYPLSLLVVVVVILRSNGLEKLMLDVLVLGKRNVRKTTDIFLLALALADLLASLTGSCDIIISFSSKYTGWKLEDTSDKMVQCIVLTTLAVSAWTLTAIAFDRFW